MALASRPVSAEPQVSVFRVQALNESGVREGTCFVIRQEVRAEGTLLALVTSARLFERGVPEITPLAVSRNLLRRGAYDLGQRSSDVSKFRVGEGEVAHGDSFDGPVVRAARKVIEAGQVAVVLPWVRERDEMEIRVAFENTLAVRASSPQAQALADHYFFETVVRVHRAGARESFTGLEGGRDLGAVIPAADQAITDRSAEGLVQFLNGSMALGILGRLQDVVAAEGYQPADVRAARRYVAAYTELIRYVDRLYEAIASSEADDFGEGPRAEKPHVPSSK